ncbi:S-adenosylmethionine:tRNA ribosyltransferase-isomerase [Streptomyces chartreusis]|uniref:S-adenosylmethionine:tRNA ribosyltransferase-isomerase n=1 Tax=Streptomyces chartreusis TaxID=1969 RepID=UPI003800DCBF
MNSALKFSDFKLDIPRDLFCNSARRSASEAKLVVVNALNSSIQHDSFENLISHLEANDSLIINDSGISHSRLLGVSSKGLPLDICFVIEQGDHLWEAMALSPAGNPPEHGPFQLSGGIHGEILGRVSKFDRDRISDFDAENWIEKDKYRRYRAVVRISTDSEGLREALDSSGRYMYPWYTNHDEIDEQDLNPITTRRLGSVLVSESARRLTPAMLMQMRARGMDTISVSLWMSFGWNYWQFHKGDMPLRDNKMNYEECEVTHTAATQVKHAMHEGRRLIAVGTSSARALESLPMPPVATSARTNLFLQPGMPLKYCSGLLTNLHNSMATHIVMAATFGGTHLVLRACQEAIDRGYGFGIHGDSMLILGSHQPAARSELTQITEASHLA